MKNALATKCDDQQAITEVTDAYGNVTEIKQKKTLTKKEIKKLTKEIKAKIKSRSVTRAPKMNLNAAATLPRDVLPPRRPWWPTAARDTAS